MSAPTTIDTHEWLTAVDQHPETTNADLGAAYHMLGVETDHTPEQLDESTFRLHLLGFLWPIAVDRNTYTYELRIARPVSAAESSVLSFGGSKRLRHNASWAKTPNERKHIV